MASDQQIGLTASSHTGSLQREWRRCGKPTCRCTTGMLPTAPIGTYGGETAVGNDGATFPASG